MRKTALLVISLILVGLLAGCCGGDKTAPTISGVSTSNVTPTGAVVSWTTDEDSTSQVEYGTTTSYGSTTTLDENQMTSHSVTLSGLAPATTYHYRVKSKDAAGNEAVSGDATFTTPGALTTATSVDYKVDITYQAETMSYRYRARNLGTANPDIRIDYSTGTQSIECILSGSQQEGWLGTDGQWNSFTSLGLPFQTYWGMYYTSGLESHLSAMSGWATGDYEWAAADYAYRVYDMQVNPTLADSVFQPG